MTRKKSYVWFLNSRHSRWMYANSWYPSCCRRGSGIITKRSDPQKGDQHEKNHYRIGEPRNRNSASCDWHPTRGYPAIPTISFIPSPLKSSIIRNMRRPIPNTSWWTSMQMKGSPAHEWTSGMISIACFGIVKRKNRPHHYKKPFPDSPGNTAELFSGTRR